MGLTRAALWSEEPSTEGLPLTEEEWVEVYRLAHKQTVQGIVYDAICHLPEEFLPSGRIFSLWMPEMEALEANYQRHIRTIGWLTSRMTEGSQLRPIILKGIPLASLYPVPEHRVLGDIDVFYGNMENRDAADDLVESWGIPVMRLKNHESSYSVNNIVIEHHYVIAKSHVPWHRSQESWIENYLTSHQGPDSVSIEHVKMNILPPVLNILLLSSHSLGHVIYKGIGLRQMCDFALYIYHHGQSVNRKALISALKKYQVKRWTDLCLAYCVSYLGLPSERLPYPVDIPEKDLRMLHGDILQTGNFGDMDDRYSEPVDKGEGLLSHLFTFKRIARNMPHYFKYIPYESVSWIFSLIHQRVSEHLSIHGRQAN